MRLKTIVTLILLTIFSAIITSCTQQTKNSTGKPHPPSTSDIISVSDIQPAQIQSSELHNGLSATYFLNFYKRDVSYLQRMHRGEFEELKGEPILEINHQFQRSTVFGSGAKQGIAARMKGYIHFEQQGIYNLQAISNDGILLNIDNKLVLSDPKQHGDRYSNIGEVSVKKPGWYPLNIDYFQRKGTASLKLFWKKPGENDFIIIPGSAYGHILED